MAVPQHIRQPEIRDLEVRVLRVPVRREQQVLGLQVPVHHACSSTAHRREASGQARVAPRAQQRQAARHIVLYCDAQHDAPSAIAVCQARRHHIRHKGLQGCTASPHQLRGRPRCR